MVEPPALWSAVIEFFAFFWLITGQGHKEKSRAIIGPALSPGLRRRSGCSPAEPYPPLGKRSYCITNYDQGCLNLLRFDASELMLKNHTGHFIR